MAVVPFTFESNFEQGDNLEWDSQDDTVLDFPHYGVLAASGQARTGCQGGAQWGGAVRRAGEGGRSDGDGL